MACVWNKSCCNLLLTTLHIIWTRTPPVSIIIIINILLLFLTRFVSWVSIIKLWTCFSALSVKIVLIKNMIIVFSVEVDYWKFMLTTLSYRPQVEKELLCSQWAMPRLGSQKMYGPILCCHRHVYIGNVYVDNVMCHVYNIDKKTSPG